MKSRSLIVVALVAAAEAFAVENDAAEKRQEAANVEAPVLPDRASDSARKAINETAFGKKGEEASAAAKAKAVQQGSLRAEDARHKAADKAARGAADRAAHKARGEATADAARQRATAGRENAPTDVPNGSANRGKRP